MFKLGFSLLFAVLFTCNCYPTSEELSEAPTWDTIEHEIVNVKDVETPSEGSIENHEDHEEYSIKDNIDASMNNYESKEGEPMSTDDPAETDTDEKGDEGEDYSEGKNDSLLLLLHYWKQRQCPEVSILQVLSSILCELYCIFLFPDRNSNF